MKRNISKIILIAALVVCMSAALPGLDAFAVTVGDLTVGVNPGTIVVYESGDIKDCNLTAGSVPPGMTLNYRPNTNVNLQGTPDTAGTYSFSCVVGRADGGSYAFDVSVYVVNAVDVEISEDDYLAGGISGGNTNTDTNTTNKAPAKTAPKITKHPTGETVEAGGAAKFIARAENASKFTWRIVSKDTTCTYKATEAEYYFPGLEVSGTDTDTLILSNIPASMSTWSVECMFQNDYGNSFTNGAIITVKSNAPAPTATPKPTQAPATKPADSSTGKNNGSNASTGSNNNANASGNNSANTAADPNTKPANFTTQPMSTKVKKGNTVTLNVYATSPDNGEISYQWYSAPVNDRSAALPISGATGESYEVTPTEQAVYYWAAAWNTKEGKRSEAVYTNAAEVMIIPEATPTPAPTPVPTAPPAEDGGFLGGNFQLILFAAIGLFALAALVGVVIYLRIESKREDE